MDPKPGSQTTEFKVTAIVVAICTVLVTFGVIKPEQQDAIITAAGAVAAALASIGYSWARGRTKGS